MADTAMLLFGGTQPVHGLRARARRALEVAAQLRGINCQDQTATTPEPPDIPDGLPGHVAKTVAAVWDIYAPSAEGDVRLTGLQPAQRSEAQVLAGLLLVAQALGKPTEQRARLEEIRVNAKSVVLILGGPGAGDAARRVGQRAGLWRTALGRGLSTEIGPASDDDLAAMAAGPRVEDGSLSGALQHFLAPVLLDWQTAWHDCRAGHAGAPTALLSVTHRASQVLAIFRPILKRRPTKRLRAELARLSKRLGEAGRAQAAQEDAAAYGDGQPPDAAQHLAPLAQTASDTTQATSATIADWANSTSATATALRLRVFISDLPLRRKHEETTLAAAAPGLLLEAADHLARRQATFSAAEPDSWRRTALAVNRLRVAIGTLGEASLGDTHVVDLLRDLDRAANHLDTLLRLDAVEQAVVAYLDSWAERQGRRKAPQLHGAEAVLDYRQQRRAERVRELRELAEAWKPLRGRKLRRRAAAVLGGALG